MATRNTGSGVDTSLLLTLGAIGAGYFLVVQPILQKLGLKADPEVKAQEAQNNNQVVKWKDDILKKQQPTKSEYEWKVIADTIYNDLRYSALDDKDDDAVYQLCRVRNDADFALLVTKFAKRTEYWFGINNGKPKDLAAFVKSNLNAKRIAIVNGNYSRKGVKFSF